MQSLSRYAAKRGVAMSFNAVQDFQKTRRGKVRVLTVEQMQQDGELRGQLGELLAEHLVPHGVHRVCEEFLARTKACLSLEQLRSRLLGAPRILSGTRRNQANPLFFHEGFCRALILKFYRHMKNFSGTAA